MGRGSRWGVMGNFGQGQTIRVVAQETLTSLCSTPAPQPCFTPSKSFQSRQGRSVAQSDGCLFFCLGLQYGPVTVTARQDLSSTEKERAAIANTVQNVLLGGHVVVWGGGLGVGVNPQRISF